MLFIFIKAAEQQEIKEIPKAIKDIYEQQKPINFFLYIAEILANNNGLNNIYADQKTLKDVYQNEKKVYDIKYLFEVAGFLLTKFSSLAKENFKNTYEYDTKKKFNLLLMLQGKNWVDNVMLNAIDNNIAIFFLASEHREYSSDGLLLQIFNYILKYYKLNDSTKQTIKDKIYDYYEIKKIENDLNPKNNGVSADQENQYNNEFQSFKDLINGIEVSSKNIYTYSPPHKFPLILEFSEGKINEFKQDDMEAEIVLKDLSPYLCKQQNNHILNSLFDLVKVHHQKNEECIDQIVAIISDIMPKKNMIWNERRWQYFGYQFSNLDMYLRYIRFLNAELKFLRSNKKESNQEDKETAILNKISYFIRLIVKQKLEFKPLLSFFNEGLIYVSIGLSMGVIKQKYTSVPNDNNKPADEINNFILSYAVDNKTTADTAIIDICDFLTSFPNKNNKEQEISSYNIKQEDLVVLLDSILANPWQYQDITKRIPDFVRAFLSIYYRYPTADPIDKDVLDIPSWSFVRSVQSKVVNNLQTILDIGKKELFTLADVLFFSCHSGMQTHMNDIYGVLGNELNFIFYFFWSIWSDLYKYVTKETIVLKQEQITQIMSYNIDNLKDLDFQNLDEHEKIFLNFYLTFIINFYSEIDKDHTKKTLNFDPKLIRITEVEKNHFNAEFPNQQAMNVVKVSSDTSMSFADKFYARNLISFRLQKEFNEVYQIPFEEIKTNLISHIVDVINIKKQLDEDMITNESYPSRPQRNIHHFSFYKNSIQNVKKTVFERIAEDQQAIAAYKEKMKKIYTFFFIVLGILCLLILLAQERDEIEEELRRGKPKNKKKKEEIIPPKSAD